MKWPLDLLRKTEFAFERLCADDSKDMARLHSLGFNRPWNDGEFRSFLNEPTVFGFIARPIGKSFSGVGFVLVRYAGDEAEILTLAVEKTQRRKGVGLALMETALRTLYAMRAKTLFLEVDEQNNAALNLYRQLRFMEVGKRPAYYDTDSGKSSALVMKLDLQ